jgi:hypothetical protein
MEKSSFGNVPSQSGQRQEVTGKPRPVNFKPVLHRPVETAPFFRKFRPLIHYE